ncbi:MAG: acyltransferase [Lachnospiraceae bacterium]
METQMKERNVGIELLRIVSMMMVVIMHCLGHGGILTNTEFLSSNYTLAWLLEIACYGAVNLYALITGYVCWQTEHKWKRIIPLWIEVFFYSFVVTLFFNLFINDRVDIGEIARSLFPVLKNQYWYFAAYFCMFFLMPFMNIMLDHLTGKQHTQLVILLLVYFSFLSLICPLMGNEIFDVNRGYSIIWLMVMYITGAFLKRIMPHLEQYDKKIFMILYLLCVFIVFVSKLVIAKITVILFGQAQYEDILIQYNSPFIVLGAVFLFIFFARLTVQKVSLKKIIMEVAAVSFGVYIISEQQYIRSKFVVDSLREYADRSWYIMLSALFLHAVMIYIVCTVIEYIRKKLFARILLK